jgi:hypothetical protein
MRTAGKTAGQIGPFMIEASNKFGVFKPEPEQDVRRIDIASSQIIDRMRQAWGECKVIEGDSGTVDYIGMLERFRGIGHSAKDIETFSIVLAGFQGEKSFPVKAGSFLSTLINSCDDTEFIIHTAHLTEPVDVLGYRNTKSIIVHGDAGAHLGDGMQGGTIRVDGNADYAVGYSMEGGIITIEKDVRDGAGMEMKGGTIIVECNSRNFAGYEMRGGTVRVEGNAGVQNGHDMTGGEIFFDGSIGSIAETFKGGKIFHKGELIAGK